MDYDRAIKILSTESPTLAQAVRAEIERLKGIANRNAKKGKKAAEQAETFKAAAEASKKDAAIYKQRWEKAKAGKPPRNPFEDFFDHPSNR